MLYSHDISKTALIDYSYRFYISPKAYIPAVVSLSAYPMPTQRPPPSPPRLTAAHAFRRRGAAASRSKASGRMRRHLSRVLPSDPSYRTWTQTPLGGRARKRKLPPRTPPPPPPPAPLPLPSPLPLPTPPSFNPPTPGRRLPRGG